MQSIRRLFYKIAGPDSKHPLALFHHCDFSVMHQMRELSQLMKTNPDNLDRRSQLLRQLKDSQHNLIGVFKYLVETAIPDLQISTEFRIKYPDEMQTEDFNGSIWFGAECLAAGSQIANHEIESLEIRPYATRLSKSISQLRQRLRDESQQYYYHEPFFSERVKELLKEFDRSWVDFEFRYMSIMFNIRTETQLLHQHELAVLFSEATLRAIGNNYFTEDMLEMMDPTIMFSIPRLSIIFGLTVNVDGPINPRRPRSNTPSCFKQYNRLLTEIKDSLSSLSEKEIISLEKALCSCEDANTLSTDGSVDNEALKALFISISKVADQLQSNYPRDLRAIMKQAYIFTLSKPEDEEETMEERRRREAKLRDRFDMPSDSITFDLSLTSLMHSSTEMCTEWEADSESHACHSCHDKFSFFRRKHHCRACGKVVCAQCSPHYLPQGPKNDDDDDDDDERLLRVCNTCYIRELGKITQSLSLRPQLPNVTSS
ncbi:PREDICTED: lateral signaling target protein 2 homolog [Amphimedon queenslandica]|uniref:FYVE-type domain-containing protein n=1 Tax=Amphimedon queenslandica TaxID=400682 RepID=A0A1X7VDK0_AMPQE|nr:PREDICTED: lateral signaling target protein 2 homolog [Amphimedon queenslandica]|eukprot:XP_019849392.1 PREDICTED: lateral signaling target protein 2 homolog [Amphimedon queenslandica]